jgi:hypothetical protein
MIDPARVALFIPNELKKFKLDLFNRIGDKIKAAGGRTVRGDYAELDALPADIMPIVGASPELLPLVQGWRARGRKFITWDRGYFRRVFATWLPRGENGGYYRWHVGSYQAQQIRDVPSDRWDVLKIPVQPWRKGGRHIVIAAPSRTYSRSHPGCRNWIADTIDALARVTNRQLVIRDKESKRPLQADLDGAHCLVTHGSIAAVEAVICGCPVFVDQSSAAALVGRTDLGMIEKPIYPEREKWCCSLAASQWNERELTDGTLFRELT